MALRDLAAADHAHLVPGLHRVTVDAARRRLDRSRFRGREIDGLMLLRTPSGAQFFIADVVVAIPAGHFRRRALTATKGADADDHRKIVGRIGHRTSSVVPAE